MSQDTRAQELLAPFEPGPRDPFDLAKAGHLANRAGSGASLAERERLARLGPAAAVDEMFRLRAGDAVEDLLEEVLAAGDLQRLRAWRVWRLLAGRNRIAERMAYFWHGHFATSNRKVNQVRWMGRQLDVFDRLGLGRFDDLLLAVSQDPAMLRWLDADSNVKGRPNENFARELLELFALGRGSYGEHDVQEAARAFTGWQIHDERPRMVARLHDAGVKEVLGQRGAWQGQDVVRLAAEHPASARFLARKWLAFFVHPEPGAAEIEALAAVYTAHGRDVAATLRVLLRSRLFFAPRAWRARVRAPADWVVGLVRALGANAAPTPLAAAMTRLGEALLEPPSVEGWRGERAWLTPATWLQRGRFAEDLLGGRGAYRLSRSAEEVLAEARDGRARADLALRVLLDDRVEDGARAAVRRFAEGPGAAGPDGPAAILVLVSRLPEAQLL
ncbi:MAG: DUF1800 domain-containing protein [Planctomycetes bacterium]|nr:DUF1800 domain-containing protein [Planctomycetota bacterium]